MFSSHPGWFSYDFPIFPMVFLWVFPWFLVGLSYGFSHVVFPSIFFEEFIQLATHLRSNRHVSLDLPGYRRALCHRAGGAGVFQKRFVDVCFVCIYIYVIYIYIYGVIHILIYVYVIYIYVIYLVFTYVIYLYVIYIYICNIYI